MIRKTIISLLVFFCTAILGEQKLTLHFFGSPTCGECMEIKEEVLLPLEKKNESKIDLKIHDIDTERGFDLLLQMEESYKVTQSSAIMLFFPDTFLSGANSIMQNGPDMISSYLDNPDKWADRDVGPGKTDFATNLKDRFESYTLFSIMAAGLIDGINPCAIATMIFLISFLATQKRKRQEVLLIGLSFTSAVFITYMLLGIGAFHVLGFLKEFRWVSQSIRWSAVGLAGVVGLVSFRDALTFKKSGKTADIKLQLPKTIKLRIHKVISGNLSRQNLLIGAFTTGFLVTLLEAVCTGQVYLPTIILMTRQEGLRLTGWLYLIMYNILFVLPLLIIMVLAYFGLRWDKLARSTQKNMVAIKVLFGIVLLSLAVFLAVAG
ncbi:MAG: cytochrome c biogenesis CcdA family protein [Chitinispirillaceae bacterium]